MSAAIIACGALAHEIAELRRANDWRHLDVQCLPPELHNRPRKSRTRFARRSTRRVRSMNRSSSPTAIAAPADCWTKCSGKRALSAFRGARSFLTNTGALSDASRKSRF